MHEGDSARLDASDSAAYRITGVFLAITGTFLFALKSIFIKLAFAAGADATELLVLRLVFSLPFYVGVLLWLRRSPDSNAPPRRQIVGACLMGFLGYYLASWLDLKGLEYISAQLERMTLFTYPTMIALLAWMFLGEPLGKRILASLLLCYAGIYLMYRGEQSIDLDSKTVTGVLLVVGAALSFSFYVLLAKPAMQSMGSRCFTSWAMIGSTFFITAHFAATTSVSALTNLSPIVFAYGGILAFVCTVLPSFMINEAIVRLGATRTTVIGSLGPVLTMGLAIVVLKESSSAYHLIGMAIVVLGVAFVSIRPRREEDHDDKETDRKQASIETSTIEAMKQHPKSCQHETACTS